MIEVTASCSFCHEPNRIRSDQATYCRREGCGHRADCPRHCCDCTRCLPRNVRPPDPVPWGIHGIDLDTT